VLSYVAAWNCGEAALECACCSTFGPLLSEGCTQALTERQTQSELKSKRLLGEYQVVVRHDPSPIGSHEGSKGRITLTEAI